MSELFRNQYRISSTRLQDFDYSSSGEYFVTICTKNRRYCFGNVVETPKLGVSTDVKMQLSPIGQIAQKYWLEIPQHFPFVTLDEFIIMPNHIHGIVVINHDNVDVRVETPKLGVSTGINNINHWSKGCLGLIINQYKRICTIKIRKIFPDFAWQTRFYEHVIRDDQSLEKTREYILSNPYNWGCDKYNTKIL